MPKSAYPADPEGEPEIPNIRHEEVPSRNSWSAIMALGVVGAIVPLVVGIVFQKQIISGLTAGVGKF